MIKNKRKTIFYCIKFKSQQQASRAPRDNNPPDLNRFKILGLSHMRLQLPCSFNVI